MTTAAIRRRAALIVVGTLAGFGLLALALGGRWTALTHAVAAVPLVTIAAAALLQLASLVARSEVSRRRLCCPREAACSSGGSASTFGRLPFRCCGRVVSGPALPVGMT